MTPPKVILLVLLVSAALARAAAGAATRRAALRFEVMVSRGLLPAPQDGRLFVMLNRRGSYEPRFSAGETGLHSPPVLARDVAGFRTGDVAVLDQQAAIFPLTELSQLAPGEYSVQALFADNPDLRLLDAPGNLYSIPQRLAIDPARVEPVRLELTQQVPPEQLPEDSEYLRFLKVPSPLLSRFFGRPIFLRAAVILPRDFAREPKRRYPLRVHIGGFGQRYTAVRGMMEEDSDFRAAWLAAKAPRMILLHTDGAGPLGDPYQVNSANNGPYGDALTRELIPYVERTFRGIGKPAARVLDGHSTGGWVSLALQIFYPDFFNGVWSSSPDPVDFRAFQLIDIYNSQNAYVNRHGFESPSARDRDGDVRFTIRHECQMENVLGTGDSWTMSGKQWGSWNAAYAPRGAGGRPAPLWDPVTGAIDHAIALKWEPYDLRLVLERNWPALAPKLHGKIHISVGDADNYFLNNAVHLLDNFLARADPPYGGSIVYGAGKDHSWMALTEGQIMAQMAARLRPPAHTPGRR